mmetsp:Transcript_21965/g.50070  ORF Transcript_21965/g.50070 Transcript_21965/m.50070 type:complete len:83 (+) Transcript_21965:283-531(+)
MMIFFSRSEGMAESCTSKTKRATLTQNKNEKDNEKHSCVTKTQQQYSPLSAAVDTTPSTILPELDVLDNPLPLEHPFSVFST